MSARHAVGIVGAGMIAETLHLPVLTSMQDVRVAWIADRDPERARSLAAAYGVAPAPLPADPAQLPACDAVLLAIPLQVRRPYYEAFSARGTAVMAEKPFAVDSDEHRAILDLFPAHRIACGYQRRTFANTLLIRKLLAKGWLGPLREIVLREGDRVKRSGADSRHFDDVALAGGGVLISLGCHSLDWVVFVTGATGYEILAEDVVFDGELDRKVTARIRLETGEASVELDYCVSWLDAQPNCTELRFEHAEVTLGNAPASPVLLHSPGEVAGAGLTAPAGGATTQNQACFLEWSHFLAGLVSGTPSLVSASETLLTTALMEDIYRGARGA